jgi:hypothetical protein
MTRTVRRRLRISRDTVLFVAGLAGLVHETIVSQAERPTLLLLFAAMVGLPAFLRGDESHQPVPLQPPERDPDANV